MSDLPPLDQSQAYVVVGPNDQRGPYTMELLISEVLAGRLSEATPVWWPGLADWTTMGGHPGVAGELARRRSAAAAPAWADPTAAPAPAPAADPVQHQTAHDVAASQPSAADPYAQPTADPYAPAGDTAVAATAADPFAAPGAGTATDVPGEVGVVDADVVDAEVVDVEVIEVEGSGDTDDLIEVDEVVVVDPVHQEVFAALVARSAVRAERQSRIDAVNADLAAAVVDAVQSQGLQLGEKVEVDRGTELRFDAPDGDLVMVSLGRAAAVRPEDLQEDHVPVTISYRSGTARVEATGTSGEHGEVVVAADEWTGQSTSAVSLFLPLADYLGDDLTIDREALGRDVGSTVAVLRSKLA